jgi:hypothetical protein
MLSQEEGISPSPSFLRIMVSEQIIEEENSSPTSLVTGSQQEKSFPFRLHPLKSPDHFMSRLDEQAAASPNQKQLSPFRQFGYHAVQYHPLQEGEESKGVQSFSLPDIQGGSQLSLQLNHFDQTQVL